MYHILHISRQPQVDDSTKMGTGWSVMLQCSLGASLGEQTIKKEHQLGEPCEGYMGRWKDILVIVRLRDVLRFTKASRPLEMFDVADNTKPRRLNMPRAANQGGLRFGPARDVGG